MLSNEKWFGGSVGFYPFQIGQSLRLDGDARLSHSHQSAPTLQTKATVSFWIKLHDNNDRNIVLHTGVGTSNNTHMTLALGASNSYQGISIGQYGRNLYAGSSTTPKQRDFTNFYHFFMKFDSTSSTASERVIKLYINGDEITDGTFTQMGQGDLFPLTAQSNAIYIGGHTPGYNYFTSGNIAELNVIDGQALETTDFGESKNGVWIPKEYSGTYGNNGFRLTFEGDGTATTTDGNTAQTNIGDDQSGNGNNFAVYSSSVGSHDISKDSPTNNFCTLNPLYKQSSSTLSEGNLKAVLTSGGNSARTPSTFSVSSGKWYWEVRQSSSNRFAMGVFDTDTYVMTNEDGGTDAVEWVFVTDGNKKNNGTMTSYGSTASDGHVIMVALDVDNGAIWFGKQGSWFNTDGSSDSATVKAQIEAGTTTNSAYTSVTGNLTPVFVRQTSNNTLTANFGADDTFHGGETSAGNSDGNNGSFQYAPPSGYLALCSSNLPDTTLSPNQSEQASEHMDIFLYTGDYTTNRDIALCNFTPDFSWNKGRSLATNHVLINTSVRNGSNYPNMHSNTSDKEANEAHPAIITNGIQVSQGSDNNNNETFVNWAWKCGGSSPTKTYKVVVVSDSGNKYRFRNSADDATFAQSAVTLDLQEGGTYTFDLSDSTMSGHPLRFSTTSDGTHGGGSEYTTGVTTSGTAGSSGATVTITVASSAPALYYYCSNHSGMGGAINTNVEFGQTNFDGNVLSVSQTNEVAGFSIVKYTGNGTNPNADGVSVGHGLTSTPEMIIHKNRESTTAGNNYWTVWTPFHSGNNMSFLSFTSNNTGGWAGHDTIDSTTFSPPDSNYGNVNNEDYIVYLWHSVAGYSKIGSYEMNYNSNGTYVFCGFRPRWLMTKPIDQSGSWSIYDSERDPFNDGDANMSQAEATTTEASFANSAVDFLSNGFKLRQSSDGYSNIATNTAIFMAFAEQPFKFSNAR